MINYKDGKLYRDGEFVGNYGEIEIVEQVNVGGVICSPACVESGIKRMQESRQFIKDLRKEFDEVFTDKTVEDDWQEFWKDIVCKDGQLDIEQVKKELYDYHLLLHRVPKVYEHVTGGMITKANADPAIVCQQADQHYQAMYEDFARDEEEVS